MLRFAGDTLLVYDGAQPQRVLGWSAKGKPLFARRLPEGVRVLQLMRDSVDVEVRPGTDSAAIRRIALADSGGRDVVRSSDSSFASAALWLTRSRRTPGFAFTGSNAMLLGEGFRYRLVLYTGAGAVKATGGRSLAPRGRSRLEISSIMRSSAQVSPAIIERMKADTLQHFLPTSGLQQDFRGRFWVIGERNDSTFADAFAGVTFIARVMLPCRAPGSSPSMRGRFLAVTCIRAGTTDDRDVETQLYRIVDPV
jgi:hypothetical protein